MSCHQFSNKFPLISKMHTCNLLPLLHCNWYWSKDRRTFRWKSKFQFYFISRDTGNLWVCYLSNQDSLENLRLHKQNSFATIKLTPHCSLTSYCDHTEKMSDHYLLIISFHDIWWRKSSNTVSLSISCTECDNLDRSLRLCSSFLSWCCIKYLARGLGV